MPASGASVVPEKFNWGALKCQNDDVDDHPERGKIDRGATGSLQPWVGEYSDVQD